MTITIQIFKPFNRPSCNIRDSRKRMTTAKFKIERNTKNYKLYKIEKIYKNKIGKIMNLTK